MSTGFQASLFLVAILFLAGCSDVAKNLPDYGAVPAFAMTDSNGQAFNSSQLNGLVWVADFIYTNCPGPCPRMTSQMHKIEQALAGVQGIAFVSFSVDPDHDTPEVLDNFAHRFGGPTPQWHFLTGSPATVHLLAYNTFHVGDVIGKMDHSTKLMVVDRRAKIRGYFSTFDPDSVNELLRDVRALAKENS